MINIAQQLFMWQKLCPYMIYVSKLFQDVLKEYWFQVMSGFIHNFPLHPAPSLSSHTALPYTGKLEVKRQVQQSQFTKHHPDSHYAACLIDTRESV